MTKTKQEIIRQFADEYDASLKSNHVRYVIDSLLVLSIFWVFSIFASGTSFISMNNIFIGLLILGGSLLAAISLKWIDNVSPTAKKRKRKLVVSASYGSFFLMCLTILMLRIAFEVLFVFRDTRWGDVLVITYSVALIVLTGIALYTASKSFAFKRERIESFAMKARLPLISNLIQSILVGGGVLGGILIARSDSSAPIYFVSLAMYLVAIMCLFLSAMSIYRWFTMSRVLGRSELTSETMPKESREQ